MLGVGDGEGAGELLCVPPGELDLPGPGLCDALGLPELGAGLGLGVTFFFFFVTGLLACVLLPAAVGGPGLAGGTAPLCTGGNAPVMLPIGMPEIGMPLR